MNVVPLVVNPLDKTVSLEIVARGTHLRSSEKMLLRVTGVEASTADAARRLCANPGNPVNGVRDIFWGESGPDLRGRATTTASVRVSTESDYACAFAALSSDDDTDADDDDDRLSTVIVKLDAVAVPSAVPSPPAINRGGP